MSALLFFFSYKKNQEIHLWENYPFNEVWILFVCRLIFVSQVMSLIVLNPSNISRLSVNSAIVFFQWHFSCFDLKTVHCQAYFNILSSCLHQPRYQKYHTREKQSCLAHIFFSFCCLCLYLSPFNCLQAPFPVRHCQVSPDYRKSSLLPRTCYVCRTQRRSVPRSSDVPLCGSNSPAE